jgi:hypothetical protein
LITFDWFCITLLKQAFGRQKDREMPAEERKGSGWEAIFELHLATTDAQHAKLQDRSQTLKDWDQLTDDSQKQVKIALDERKFTCMGELCAHFHTQYFGLCRLCASSFCSPLVLRSWMA